MPPELVPVFVMVGKRKCLDYVSVSKWFCHTYIRLDPLYTVMLIVSSSFLVLFLVLSICGFIYVSLCMFRAKKEYAKCVQLVTPSHLCLSRRHHSCDWPGLPL